MKKHVLTLPITKQSLFYTIAEQNGILFILFPFFLNFAVLLHPKFNWRQKQFLA